MACCILSSGALVSLTVALALEPRLQIVDFAGSLSLFSSALQALIQKSVPAEGEGRVCSEMVPPSYAKPFIIPCGTERTTYSYLERVTSYKTKNLRKF